MPFFAISSGRRPLTVSPLSAHSACRGCIEAAYYVEERGLARAVRTDEAENFQIENIEVQPTYRGHSSEVLAQVSNL